MSRYIQDSDFRRWEVFATTGEFGMSDPARISFHCRTDPELRVRAIFIDGDKSAAERAVAELRDEELLELFGKAEDLG